jgi:hypothetical protein
MKPSYLAPLPDEHLDAPTFALTPSPPTRLNGNLHAETAPDPYHQIFRGLSHPPVVSYAEACRVAKRNGLRLPAAYARPSSVTPLDLLRSPRRAAVLDLLAVLVSYGAVTNNQAAAFTGEVAYADPRSRLVADLFRSGLLAVSPAHREVGIGSVGQGAAIYKLSARSSVRELRDFLTYAEWLALTGARPLPTTSVNVRHDVLAAELALRAVALRRVGTALGPLFSTTADLVPPGPLAARVAGGPDLTLVRDDGLRIAVELTATIGRAFDQKVKRWAELLSTHSFEHTGLAVVFLTAPSLESLHDRGDHVRRDVLGPWSARLAAPPVAPETAQPIAWASRPGGRVKSGDVVYEV